MSGTVNYYDPNLFAPGAGGNFDTNQGNMGYGSVDTASQFAGALGSGLGTVLGGPLGLVNLGVAAATGQAPSMGNTIGAAKGALADLLGLGGDGGNAGPNASVGPGTAGRDDVGAQERAEDPVGKGGYADGGGVDAGDEDEEGARNVAQGALFHALMLQRHLEQMGQHHPGALQRVLARGGAV